MAHFTAACAKDYLLEYLAKDEEGFTELLSLTYVQTVGGILETCGGCTMGDGQDCSPPAHYCDEFLAVFRNPAAFPRIKDHIRYTYLSMAWSDGGCSNAFGDYHEVRHFRYFEDETFSRVSFATYDELLASIEERTSK